jgi:hypothetical protein
MQQQQLQQRAASAERQDQGASRFHQHPDPSAAASFKQQLWCTAHSMLRDDRPCSDFGPLVTEKKICSECGAESAPAGQRLPAAGGDRAWAARTGSWTMWMCCDIFAAPRLWRGSLLTTGHLSCSHPVVV